MLVCRFKNTGKDYQTYITVLHAIGVGPGSTILDFGCSWGYGSWQLQEAGFRVYSYEVSKIRAEFARRKLGCSVVGDDLVSDPIDCLFSAHVLEHLTDPNLLWRIAEHVLSPNGVVVCFLPNGDSRLEAKYGSRQYHQLWGQVHPLLVGAGAAAFMAKRHAYIPVVHTSPYDPQLLRENAQSDHLVGQELLLIARKAIQGGASCRRNCPPVGSERRDRLGLVV